MKIAVISTKSSFGKTYFALTSGGTMAKVLKEASYLFTTGSFDDYFGMVQNIDVKMFGRTPELQACIRANSLENAESFSSSLTLDGLYPICAFSDSSSIDAKANAYNGFATLVKPTTPILLEIDNMADRELNSRLIHESDVAVIISNPAFGCTKKIDDIMQMYNIKIPTFVLFNNWNPATAGTKDFKSWYSGKYFLYSYNPMALKYINKRASERLLVDIVKGGSGLGSLRNEIYSIFSYLYKPVKIPEVSKWS